MVASSISTTEKSTKIESKLEKDSMLSEIFSMISEIDLL